MNNSTQKQDTNHDWEKKAQEYLDGWKRAKADYINLKRESEKHIQEIASFAQVQLIFQMLPLFSHFEKALEHIPQEQKDRDWAKGLFQIHKQWTKILESIGLQRIETVGKKFQPEYHEAISHEKKEGFESDMIFEEAEAGYSFRGKTIKAAKVKVAN